MYFYCKTALEGSAVQHCISCNIRSKDLRDVVFVKRSVLELLSVGDDGQLTSIHEQSIFDSIRCISIIQIISTKENSFDMCRTVEEKTDFLVVTTACGQLGIVGWSHKNNCFKRITSVRISHDGCLSGFLRDPGYQISTLSIPSCIPNSMISTSYNSNSNNNNNNDNEIIQRSVCGLVAVSSVQGVIVVFPIVNVSRGKKILFRNRQEFPLS